MAASSPSSTRASYRRRTLHVVDASDRLLVPGLVNGHTHGHGALGKGLVGDRVPLEVFLSASGATNGNRSVEDKRLSTQLTAVELIRKGCTACYDLFVEIPAPSREGIEAVASAYAEVGMRAVVAPMMADRSLYQALPGLIESLPESAQEQVAEIQAAPYDASLATCREILQHWAFDRDFIRPAIAPTIPLHCSDEFMLGCAALSAEFDVGLQTHVAETKTQAVLGVAEIRPEPGCASCRTRRHRPALQRRAWYLDRRRRHCAVGGWRTRLSSTTR